MESEGVNLSSNNGATREADALEAEKEFSICEDTQHSFCQVIQKDVSDEFEFPSPNLLSQPPNFCSTATVQISHSLLSARCALLPPFA